ncbi:MAG: UDP-N-acetylmuramoyl-tripeptide--D-alanyl-D-alanine ligase [Sedimentisphaerales bacterium]|nr:UDP-N-acetylmuramoyl-tripeptide--D-alanyl-D-alanine ligase [Sedimentisphaerales bacterium]
MKELSVETLARIISPKDSLRRAEPTKSTGLISGLSTDSRTIKTGQCFFAIAGDNYNGHDYVADAFDKGAVCAVVSNKINISAPDDKILIKVDDTVQALGSLAREYRRQNNFKVIAITGSAGKTTTRHIIHHILSQRYKVFQAPENFNNNIGVPLTLLGAEPEDEIIVAELGSSQTGEIAYLSQIAQPDIATITNVQLAHLNGFGSLENIIEEKSSVAQGLANDGTLIINGDNEKLVGYCRAKKLDFLTFGRSDKCRFRAHNIVDSGLNSSFTISGAEISLPLAGSGNIDNALAAWAICSRFGIEIGDFARISKTLPAVPMRAEVLQIGTLTVISDCYNANPASMKNALDMLANISSVKKGRAVFICGDMAELAEQSSHLHKELGTLIAAARVELLLTAGDLAAVAGHSAAKAAHNDLHVESFENTNSVCNNLAKLVKDYDIVLVKGSRKVALERIIEKLKALFR